MNTLEEERKKVSFDINKMSLFYWNGQQNLD